jgi:hypothetical protein
LLALALAIAAAAGAAAQPLERGAEIRRAGCRVYTESVDTNGVATVTAECRWPLELSAVLATLRNPQKLTAALTSLGDWRRLPDGRVLQVHRVGWPLADRQVTLDWRERALPTGGIRFEYRRAARQEPLGKGRVGIREDEGRWEIRPDGERGTRLVYTSRYDAGGALKPFLVRRFQRHGIASSLEELRTAIAAR